MAQKKLKISIFELVWYILNGLLAAWGITFITFGIIIRNSKPGSDLANANYNWKQAMKTDFFTSGVLVLVAAVILAVIVLLIFAKTADSSSTTRPESNLPSQKTTRNSSMPNSNRRNSLPKIIRN